MASSIIIKRRQTHLRISLKIRNFRIRPFFNSEEFGRPEGCRFGYNWLRGRLCFCLLRLPRDQRVAMLSGTPPLLLQKNYPTRDAADKYVDDYITSGLGKLDANDLLYRVNASRNYDPSAQLEKIKAYVMWINSADDFVNPPELKIAEREIGKVKNGRFVLIPASEQTHGHGTHTWAAIWKQYLAELLEGH